MKGKPCLTNLTFFYNKMTHLVDEKKAVEVVYLNFSEIYDTVPRSILEKLAVHGLGQIGLVGHKEMSSNCARAGLDWISGRISFQRG